jgi:hypothetical protein
MKINSISYLLFLTILLFNSCTPEVEDPAINNTNGYLNKKNVGESARDLLSDEKYKHLEVEVQYVFGFAPSSEAIANLQSFLQQRLNKTKGISFKYSSISSPNRQVYTINDIAAIETAYRTVYTRKDTIGVYFFFADGGYSQDTENSKVLGVAFRNTSMALFEKTIHDFSDSFTEPAREDLETVVLNHEFAHILGLVNVGSPMQTLHQDDAHGHHCNNQNCLMYYTAETGGVVAKILGSGMPVLDQNCINDLKANGGK